MNIYVMTDAEGISGVFQPAQVLEDGNRRMEGRRLMTLDINACVHALKVCGADKVYVRDAHGGANSLLQEELTDEADYYICGDVGADRFAGIDECDGVILLGYHAMAGTEGAILEHSMSSKRVQNYWIHGQKGGEVAIDAAIAGDYGKPVILVSGDDKVCAEAKALLPWVETCEVKKGITCFGGMFLPVKAAHERIAKSEERALGRFGEMQAYTVPKPVRFRCELTERQQLPTAIGKPFLRILDGRTYEIEADSMLEALMRS